MFPRTNYRSLRSNSLVPVGELHHHIHDRDEKHEVEEAVAVCHMLSFVIMDPHPTALTIIIIIDVIILKSLVLLLSCGGIRTAGITAPNSVSLSAMGEHTDNTH